MTKKTVEIHIDSLGAIVSDFLDSVSGEVSSLEFDLKIITTLAQAWSQNSSKSQELAEALRNLADELDS